MQADLAMRHRRWWLAGGVSAVAAAAGVGSAWWQSRSTGAVPGEQLGADFWKRTFERPNGEVLSLSTLRNKPLLVNFWATWCAPCVEELPMLDRFFQQQAANGWQVIGLAIDQPAAVKKFLARSPLGFPIGLAGLQGTELIRQLGNTSGGLPFSIAFNRNGTVLDRKMGKLESADLDAWQRALVHG